MIPFAALTSSRGSPQMAHCLIFTGSPRAEMKLKLGVEGMERVAISCDEAKNA